MPDPVPVPGHDERWADTPDAAPPPGGDAWTDRDIERLINDGMAILGKSKPAVRAMLASEGGEYSPGQLRTVLDSEVLA